MAAAPSTSTAPAASKHSPLDSTHPVLVPYAEELFYDAPSFRSYIASLPIPACKHDAPSPPPPPSAKSPEELAEELTGMSVDVPRTANNDVTNLTAENALVDLFNDLTRNTSSEELNKLLNDAWAETPLITLKIIWNARSIHTGKSERALWYRCMGWLRKYHPHTLLANLEWVVRPVIPKKMAKEEGEEEGTDVGGESIVVEKKDLDDVDDPTRFDVKYGVSHGYYRDLGNLLVLAVKGKLDENCDPKEVLQTPRQEMQEGSRLFRNKKRKQKRGRYRSGGSEEKKAKLDKRAPEDEKNLNEKKPTPEEIEATAEKSRAAASKRRHDIEAQKQQNVIDMFNNDKDAFYKALHLTVARIFASQLQRDSELSASNKMKHHQQISLAAKWAPSLEKTIDRSTLLASSIAEIMFPPESIGMSAEPREEYLKQARQQYRVRISHLRRILDVVERKISAKDYSNIDISKIPSLAMKRYTSLIHKNASEQFDHYLEEVAAGKVTISGAVMMPSTLVAAVRALERNKSILAEVKKKVANGQWNTLVQRIRDSGTLENCIAVCDVSSSMTVGVGDETTAMDTAIGLSLIIASVAKEPFNNRFITFSFEPSIVTIDPTKPFSEQVYEMEKADWEVNTDLLAVFEDLILPAAITHKVPQESMIKRIFIFSDMEFDQADFGDYKSSYEVIKEKYAAAGYQMPELVFWNVASGRNSDWGDVTPTKKKPVTKDDVGTCLVSGYSHAMLKVFMDKGGFEDLEEENEEELVEIEMGEEGEEPKEVKKEKTIDPLAIVKRATNGPVYEMLQVVD